MLEEHIWRYCPNISIFALLEFFYVYESTQIKPIRVKTIIQTIRIMSRDCRTQLLRSFFFQIPNRGSRVDAVEFQLFIRNDSAADSLPAASLGRYDSL